MKRGDKHYIGLHSHWPYLQFDLAMVPDLLGAVQRAQKHAHSVFTAYLRKYNASAASITINSNAPKKAVWM
jgi:hypothetical protein